MGGGNGQKSKMAREKNLEKLKAAGKGSQLDSNKKAMTIQLEVELGLLYAIDLLYAVDSNKKAMTIQCKVCMQTFMCTTSEVKCKEHAEAKHPKVDLHSCFPHLKQ